MFWRRRCYHDCYHDHAWLSFRRGMVAMFILAFAVLGLLDYPASHHHHHASHHRRHLSAGAPHHGMHHPRPPNAHRRPPRPRPTHPRHQPRHSQPTSHHRHQPASGTTTATAGQGLTWTSFHGIQLPTSPAAGPRHTRDGLAWGFADSPRGALLAAVNIAVRTAVDWGPVIFRPTITGQVTGPNAHALLAADLRAYAQAGQTPSQPAAAEEAYRFDACTRAEATIDLVTTGPGTNGNPVLAVTRLRVLWRHGDWRLLAPPSGDWAKASAEISSLTGYTIFPSAG